jgi:hypothetical protein
MSYNGLCFCFRKPLGLKTIKDTKREILFPGDVSGMKGYNVA